MTERTDAARNRAVVLCAATELFDRDDLQHVSLERIAQVAGVGKATVLRRFGDLLGLTQAVIAPRVTDLQQQVQCGPPPLGPGGADHAAHLHAYLDAHPHRPPGR
jgi:AcrR family transcriptional regulator